MPIQFMAELFRIIEGLGAIGTKVCPGMLVSLGGNRKNGIEILQNLDGIVRGPCIADTDGIGDFGLPVNPSLTASSFAGKNLADIRALYNGSGGGSSYDISWAQDGLDQSVSLTSIEFVRVEVLSGNAEIDGIVAVPEPTSLSLAILGTSALIVARRKRA